MCDKNAIVDVVRVGVFMSHVRSLGSVCFKVTQAVVGCESSIRHVINDNTQSSNVTHSVRSVKAHKLQVIRKFQRLLAPNFSSKVYGL